MDPYYSPQAIDDDRIGLFELIEDIWNQKLLVAIFSACFIFLGYCYTLLAPEEWTAELHISDASALQIDSLNPPALVVFSRPPSPANSFEHGAQSGTIISSLKVLDDVTLAITPQDLMKSLTDEIRSIRTLLQFDAQRSESIFENRDQLTDEERIEAAKGFFENMLKITPPSEAKPYTTISLTMDSPISASSVLNNYVEFVDDKIVNNRGKDIRLAITRAIQTYEFEIERIKRSYAQRLEEDLALLEEALRIAQAAGIKDNQAGLFVDSNNNRLTEASGLYLRGERLLKAEMQALKVRISRPALIPEVRTLQAESELLRDLVIDTERASSFSLEKPATSPTGRDSPKTKLVLALALVLGGMLGILTALIRTALRNRKTKALAQSGSDLRPSYLGADNADNGSAPQI